MTDTALATEADDPSPREAVVALSLRAWAPVFASIERAMDADYEAAVFRLFPVARYFKKV